MITKRNCGLCGERTCDDFYEQLNAHQTQREACPYIGERNSEKERMVMNIEDSDTHGNVYDFVIHGFPDEISARKIIQPLRPDLVEKLGIKEGDYVRGRPMGAGCPVTHVLKVYKVDVLAGLLYTWVVGPLVARENEVIDIAAYSMIGFEGIISHVNKEPAIGKRSSFLPAFCMIRLNHSGLVNTIYKTEHGTVVRIEGIAI